MSEGQDEGQEKSHLPTQRKLEKSREQGETAYSAEVTTAATYLALFVAVLIAGGWMASKAGEAMISFHRNPEAVSAMLMSPAGKNFVMEVIGALFIAIGPLFALLAVATIVSLTAQRAVVFAPNKIMPKLNRLSVIDNAKQKYGPNGLGEFVKSMAKITAIIAILLFAFKDRFLELPGLAAMPVQATGPILLRETIFFLGLITAVATGIAALDMPWKKYRHEKKLMMSFEEIKKESRETEGDPTLKGARQERAREIATNRMMLDVPKANVVIVNPTHYAVALQWDRHQGGAPVCVAKGVDKIAASIRAAASEAGVPIKRDPPTARSIHALVEIGDEIRKEHYAAVAAAIHFADDVRKKAKGQYSS